MKLLKIISATILTAYMIYLSSCSEIIEEDISADTVRVIGPVDTIVNYSTITFWWHPVNGATSYRLQLITPTVANPLRIALDTLVADTKFDYTPDIGQYEWRIRAENSGYQSVYTEPRKLEVKHSSDLSKVIIVLRTPANNLVTRDTLVRFSWDEIPIASSYELRIEGGGIQIDTVLDSNSFQYKLSKNEMNYHWRVQAANDISSTTSTEFQFTIDGIPPSAPVLQAPKTDSAFALSSPVNFVWQRQSGVVMDSFRIEKKQSDDTWLLLPGFTPRKVMNPELTLSKEDFNNPATTADYRWTVISIDQAGNKSTPVHRTFTIGSL